MRSAAACLYLSGLRRPRADSSATAAHQAPSMGRASVAGAPPHTRSAAARGSARCSTARPPGTRMFRQYRKRMRAARDTMAAAGREEERRG